MPKVLKRNIPAVNTAVGGTKKGALGAKKSKLYNMPEKIKEGTVLKDLTKTEWTIGPSIGTGGFGEIYSACNKGENKYNYVVKCEPHDNGPLFVEMHFYMRNARFDDIKKFQKEHGIKSLGMPYMVGNGSTDINGIKHRFIVMPRYGIDVSKIFVANGRKIPEGTCYRLAMQMLDVFEFIHGCGYVHADLKASNILLGCGKQQHQAYLVDFGLASHYTIKEFKPDPKKMHNGTIEYTSRDSHLGVATMRTDFEILGYNLIEWLGADLPWVKNKLLTFPVKVQKAKEHFMSDVVGNLKIIFPNDVPIALANFLEYVAKMEYNDKPDYEKCRKIFTLALKDLRIPLTGDLDFKFKSNGEVNINVISTLNNKTAKLDAKKKPENYVLASEDKTIDISDDDDDSDYLNYKKKLKNKKLLRTSRKPSSRHRGFPNKLSKNGSTDLESSPSSLKDSKLNVIKSKGKKNSPNKKNRNLQTTSLSSPDSKACDTPIYAEGHVKRSPAVTMLSSRSGKTVINDRITPTKKPSKTYEFNFELDVSMDANVIVNVKRKKKAFQLSRDVQNSNTPSGKNSSATSNTTPVKKVKVRKVSIAENLNSPPAPAVAIKKSRRIQIRPN